MLQAHAARFTGMAAAAHTLDVRNALSAPALRDTPAAFLAAALLLLATAWPATRAIARYFGRCVDRLSKHAETVSRTAELERANAQLAHANRELARFAVVVAHDLKAPLRAITSLADLLAQDCRPRLDAAGRERLDLLINRARHAHALIDGILRYSCPDRARQDETWVDLNVLVNQVVDLVAPPPHISVRIENALPTIKCDRTRMQQVFQNLVDNAVKFMDKPRGDIRVGAHPARSGLHFYVADNGPGIGEERHNGLFRIFPTRQPSGDIECTGIGLAVVKRIVEGDGGRVWFDTRVGQGTTFHVSFRLDAGRPPPLTG